ncbi:DUF2171 domain-containing protein [Sphingosinicella sp. LHD-64]|uniref:DUF2171 domain-containing protein n=1 Tax=Sphingosinicella sp. LHD-64 TaxID=3072139 RepID=UPI00280D79AE|nr:DUF2171 domain-containing protein [Sphingosinicella sp. LHD-64]MDQ8757103.1 DUF2171 domain-containing protein [Sphingosinicella sp. LHD-64]
MAYDERTGRRYRPRGWRGRDEDWGRGDWERERGPEWRGDPAFGSGWGNQTARSGGWRDEDRYIDDDRYHPGAPEGHGYGPPGRSDVSSGGPGFDAGFGSPRFDRLDVGSTGTHGAHPISSPSSPAYAFSPGYGGAAREDAIRRRDPHYAAWRRRQIAALDSDYEEYHRENQSRFDREFSAWRSRRGAQREAVGRVTEHMEVVGADGSHVGTVDKVRGDTIILTKSDPSAGGVHHAIPCGWIDRVEDKVTLTLTAEEATERWRTESRSRALFERPDSGQDGPHILNRSFSGTYRDDE